MIIIPIKWLFHWEYTQHFQTNPYVVAENDHYNPREPKRASQRLALQHGQREAQLRQAVSQVAGLVGLRRGAESHRCRKTIGKP